MVLQDTCEPLPDSNCIFTYHQLIANSMTINSVIQIVVALFAVVAACTRNWSLLSRKRFPPGPFPWPIIGNAAQISIDAPWETFTDWSRKYGWCL